MQLTFKLMWQRKWYCARTLEPLGTGFPCRLDENLGQGKKVTIVLSGIERIVAPPEMFHFIPSSNRMTSDTGHGSLLSSAWSLLVKTKNVPDRGRKEAATNSGHRMFWATPFTPKGRHVNTARLVQVRS